MSDVEFIEWKRAVNKRLYTVYAITIDDSGIDDEYLKVHWKMNQSQYEFVEWFGIKYDLAPRTEIEQRISRTSL